MIKGESISLRLVRDEEEIRRVVEEYNDISQRADTDHNEMKSPAEMIHDFNRNGLWTGDAGTCLIVDTEDRPVGMMSFHALSEFELELGYRIFRNSLRKKGYVSEALRLFSRYLFESKPIRRLRIQTASDNSGSQRVAEKCGFVREGVLRQGYFYRGRVCDFVIFGLLREEVALS